MERQPQKWIRVLSKWRDRDEIHPPGGASLVVCADAVFPLASFHRAHGGSKSEKAHYPGGQK